VLIYLARHGHFHNEYGASRGDAGLSSEGRDQARALGEALSDQGISALYTSPLRRAGETANVVGDVLGLEPWVLGGLAEHDSPETAEGRTGRKTSNTTIRIQEDAFYASAGELLETLWQRHGVLVSRIALISHGNMLSTLVSSALDLEPRGYVRFIHDFCGLTILETAGDRTRVLCLNATGHLTALESEADSLPT
jgi:probable phosphoglycerate mutase